MYSDLAKIAMVKSQHNKNNDKGKTSKTIKPARDSGWITQPHNPTLGWWPDVNEEDVPQEEPDTCIVC